MKGFLLSTLNTTITPNIIAFSNDLVTGNQSVSVGANGWNLVGNPYPSAISWDIINPFTGVDDIVYIWDPNIDNFVSYVAGTGGNPSCQYIQIGQSFFIYATTATSFGLNRPRPNSTFVRSRPIASAVPPLIPTNALLMCAPTSNC